MVESGYPVLTGNRVAVGFQPVVIALGRETGDDQPPVLGRQWCEGDLTAALRNTEAGQRW